MKLVAGDIANFIEFLDKTPTPFHVLSELSGALTAAGCERITLSGVDRAERGKAYFIPFGDTAVVAFFAGSKSPSEAPGRIRMAAAHVDYPVLKVKNTGLRKGNGILRLNVEMYGGAIVHPWLDRPLKLCGRVVVKTPEGLKSVDVSDFGKRFVIPNAAIHMNHGVNDGAKFSIQNQLLPFFGLDTEEGEEAFANMIASKVASLADITEVKVSDIMSFDLSLVVAGGATLCGADNEFIQAQGLDDRAMVHSIFTGFCEAVENGIPEDDPSVRIAFAFNHEECGSQTDTGAKSAFAAETVKAIASRFFPGEHSLEVCQRSLLLSSDMGHATHPSFPEFSDSTSPVVLGGGIVLKTMWNQSYSTAAGPMAEFAYFCEKNNIPYQRFSNNADSRGGGTIGPVLAAALGIKTCDIGSPLLAMHSPMELGAVSDHLTAEELFGKFFAPAAQ